MSNDLKEVAAATALNVMMERGWLSICTIDQVAKLLGRNPRGDAYDVLHTLHCVNFDKMPRDLRDQIPSLIQQCLDVAPTDRFATPRAGKTIDVTPPAATAEATHEPPRRGILRLLWSGR